jgi:peptide/nickel transport system permease protein
LIRHQYGLNKSLPEQYINWVGGVLHGNLGASIYYNTRVGVLISERIPITFTLGVMAFLVSGTLGILFGVVSALRRGSWIDTLVTMLANIGITMPGFWVGILLIYFLSLSLHLLPTNGYTPFYNNPGMWAKQAIMPVICLSLFSIASLTRQTRSAMLEVIQQDYIRTAWAKGLKERLIISRHTIKNALIPVVTVMGMQVGLIFGGSVFIETVFNIPGVGRLMAQSVSLKDFQIVQGGVLIISSVVILTNLIVDISYGWLDPRIRYD